MEVSSFAHCEIALLLQAAYSDYQTGAFENFHQLVEDTLIVLRPGPKIFFQYELRFVNCLKSQLLIGHSSYPSKLLCSHLLLLIKKIARLNKKWKIKSILGNIPRFFELPHQILFQWGGPQRTIAAASWLNTASDVGTRGRTLRDPAPRV